MTITLESIVSKLGQELLDKLTEDEKSFVAKQTLDLNTLINAELTTQEASIVLLKAASLLAVVPIEYEWPSNLAALDHFEEKELFGVIKRVAALPCYKTFTRKKKAVKEEVQEDTSKKSETEKDEIPF